MRPRLQLMLYSASRGRAELVAYVLDLWRFRVHVASTLEEAEGLLVVPGLRGLLILDDVPAWSTLVRLAAEAKLPLAVPATSPIPGAWAFGRSSAGIIVAVRRITAVRRGPKSSRPGRYTVRPEELPHEPQQTKQSERAA